MRFKVTVFCAVLCFFVVFETRSERCKKKEKNDPPETYISKLDSLLEENSGLIYWRNMLWTINDSGGENQVYGYDIRTGEIKITIELTNATNRDWEDIAQDDKYIYIAETGNNSGGRKDLQIFMLKKSGITMAEHQKHTIKRLTYKYADQTHFGLGLKKHNFDCEALMAYNDSLYLFTKDRLDLKTRTYAMPAIPGDYVLAPIDSFNVNGLVTGADINAAGEIVLIGYKKSRSFAWTFKKTEAKLFDHPKYIDLNMLLNAQTEGVCFDPSGNILFSCEKTNSYKQQVWILRKNEF